MSCKSELHGAVWCVNIFFQMGVDTSKRGLHKHNMNSTRTEPETQAERFGITAKQHEALVFIRDYIRETGGISPSMDEIKEGLNLSSKSGAHGLVSGLVQRGYLRRLPIRSRSIQIVE
jgi:hypothetical protein